MDKTILKRIIQGGVILSFISVLLVYKGFLFPYITTKQIYFNILIEIIFILWIYFLLRFPSEIPKKSYISIGLLFFFAVLILSAFFGVDFNLSFWGDIERMLGIFHLLHFLILYFVIITVFKSWQEWRILFLAFLFVSAYVAIYGTLERYGLIKVVGGGTRIISTIGNSAYVGGYAIFNIFFALIIFFKEKNKFIKTISIVLLFFSFLAFAFSSTRGAYIGLALGVIITLLLIIFFNKNKTVKLLGIALIVAGFLSVSLVFLNKNSDFVKDSVILSRMVNISLRDATMQTRFLSWKTAWQDFHNHPYLGTGFGNFAITFDKYFDPIFYSYTASETYFDRAHNNIVDITTTSGALGLISYLLIFVFAIYYLAAGYRKKVIGIYDLSLIIGLIIAYFVQNLAVFDSLPTYIPLMILLAYIYFLNHSDDKENSLAKLEMMPNILLVVMIITIALTVGIIYKYNIQVIAMLRNTIISQTYFSVGDVIGAYDAQKRALSYDTVLDRDSRISFSRSLVSNPTILANQPNEKVFEILRYSIELVEKNLKYDQADSLTLLQYAQILGLTARFYARENDKFNFEHYSSRSLEAINKSIEASAGRVPTYFVKAQIYLSRGEKEKAIEVLKTSINLNKDYIDSTCQLAKVYLSYDMKEEGIKEMDKCLEKNGANVLMDGKLIVNLIEHYTKLNDLNKVINLYEALTNLDSKNSKIWTALAQLYYQKGDKENAIKAAIKAAEYDKSLEGSVEKFKAMLGE